MTGRTRVELHFHLLPGVDDGPRDLDEALDLARLAVADRTGVVVCTPHVELVDVGSLPGRVAELDTALRAAGIPLAVAVGGEIRAGRLPRGRGELEILAHGPPGGRWVLLEAPLEPAQIDAFHADADELDDRGFGLVIAHPERCAPLMSAGGGLDGRLARGARLQVNASSLTGGHGPAAQAAGFDLAARGLIDVIASDAHGRHRPPSLEAASRLLEGRGIDAARLVADEPQRLLRVGIDGARRRPAA